MKKSKEEQAPMRVIGNNPTIPKEEEPKQENVPWEARSKRVG